ncbi:MAG TPA: RNA 2',3'-cyclic phosphodiesterase [Candidatus Limnocylindrales bacterium]|nr:RNA 2',3'-cyclic phosphodiesterase [Candidatus Limnocylindrales bacterium]
MTGWRTFIAIALPSPLQQALRAPIAGLADVDAARTSAVDRIHLTLHFLGNLSPDAVAELGDRIAPRLVEQPPFEVEVAGVGAFPSLRRPQTLYADLREPGLDRVIGLQASLRPALEEAGLAVDRRAYRPHLTLARLRRPPRAQERRRLEEWAATLRDARFGALQVDRVSLMRSELGGGPPRYTELRTFPLQ